MIAIVDDIIRRQVGAKCKEIDYLLIVYSTKTLFSQ